MERMAPSDVQTYWMSDKIPNDQFLLYASTGFRKTCNLQSICCSNGQK